MDYCNVTVMKVMRGTNVKGTICVICVYVIVLMVLFLHLIKKEPESGPLSLGPIPSLCLSIRRMSVT